MGKSVVIDPITRIEGHLAIKVEVEQDRIVNAECRGEMFRGFEVFLRGRDPMDAQQITQRICGVCPISHGIASILAQDMAYQIRLPSNGRLVRNLIQGANFIQSHIIHFYHLSALDFIDIAAITKYTGQDPILLELKTWVEFQISSKMLYPAAPFLPRYESQYLDNVEINIQAIKHYLDALEMRKLAHKMAAIFCGKIPHAATLIPGGVSEHVNAQKIINYFEILKKLHVFIDTVYLPDVIAVAKAFPQYFKMGKGCNNFLAFGVFKESADSDITFLPGGVVMSSNYMAFNSSKITEDVRYSRYSSQSGSHPTQGETIADPHKTGAYSWLKAPRYDGQTMEVGPLARIIAAYVSGKSPLVTTTINQTISQLNIPFEDLVSVMGRHLVRALETKLIAEQCFKWLDQLVPDAPCVEPFTIPSSGEGVGLTEAPRGALGHWIEIADKKIKNYQCVVPTTWNCSPRDDKGNPGPVELALIGTSVSDIKNPIEAARVVRSFDPCIACAVH
ncbi:MAG: nickel-dependent hydrogenase large subunit [Desulfobacterales bacterium]|nr:nickel-dependent hydrogenase large subunit [Desulfobacterales bacterium]